MNKKNLRKGFTTVELVIVIAVIAILATALIPTFGGLINSANETAAMNEARQIYNDFLLDHAAAATGESADFLIKTTDGYYYEVENGSLKVEDPKYTPDSTNIPTTGVTIIDKDGKCNHGATTKDSDNKCALCGETVSNG